MQTLGLDQLARRLQQTFIVPDLRCRPQSVTVTAAQQTDSEGDTVDYEQTFVVTNIRRAWREIAVSVNQLPLAAEFRPCRCSLQPRLCPDAIGGRAGLRRQAGRFLYFGAKRLWARSQPHFFSKEPPPAPLSWQTAVLCQHSAGSSLTFTVSNVFVPAALAGTSNTTFVAVAGARSTIKLERLTKTVSGPLIGSMASSLSVARIMAWPVITMAGNVKWALPRSLAVP